MAFPAQMCCVIIVKVVAKEEEGEKCNLEPVLRFTRAHDAYKAVKSFFYTHSTGGRDKQNILNLEFPNSIVLSEAYAFKLNYCQLQVFCLENLICIQVLTEDCMCLLFL